MNAPRLVFALSAALLALSGAFVYGAAAYRADLPPIPQLKGVADTLREIVSPGDAILSTTDLRYEEPLETRLPDAVQPGLLLVSANVGGRRTAVRVIDRDGTIIHEWHPVWTEIWPENEGTFPENRRPVDDMILHGIDILPDGSFVANFEHLSTFRMGVCGEVMWKLDNLGHHSVDFADDGTLWVSSERYVPQGGTGYPNHAAPLRSWTLQNLDRDGTILREIPVIDILLENDLAGLLYMSSLTNGAPVVSGDTLHLNDVESYPVGQPSDVFAPGDLAVSLRNINAVFVVDPDSLEVKFLSIGQVMRQHDPDFLPNGRISVFDNRNFTSAPGAGPAASRIVELDPVTGAAEVVLDGTGAEPFYTEIMGVHERLANGNILVVPSGEGRVLEFTPDGALAWRYDNRYNADTNRRVYGALVLPPEMDADFFARKRAACPAAPDA